MPTDPEPRTAELAGGPPGPAVREATDSGSEEAALEALLALLTLDDLPRTGWILRGVERPESVAGHVLGVAHAALALAPRVVPPLDLGLVLAMALVHDAPEARTGDLPRPAATHLPPGAKANLEARIAQEVVHPLSGPAAEAFAEYQAGASREARFVRACDRIQLGVRLLGYERAGRRGLEEFWTSLDHDSVDEFEPCRRMAAALRSLRREP